MSYLYTYLFQLANLTKIPHRESMSRLIFVNESYKKGAGSLRTGTLCINH